MRKRERERERERERARERKRKRERELVVYLFGFLTSFLTTRLYRGRAPRQSVCQFYMLPHMRQSWETMTSVSAGHIILTPTLPVGSGRPQRESNPGPPHQESHALPTELPRPPPPPRERERGGGGERVCVSVRERSISFNFIAEGNDTTVYCNCCWVDTRFEIRRLLV